jgi:hypothetical protein
MRGTRVDPESRTVRVEGGCRWGDVDHATHAFGMATPSGIISTTGVAGLTLGGGFGHLSRRYGLSCDNLISAYVVTADGRFLTASADRNEDLFWGLRGGGGNFGVVTSFEFKLYPVKTVFGGPVFYPIERAGDVLRFYREYVMEAPEEMGIFFGLHLIPPLPTFPAHLHNKPTCILVVCYTGPMEKAEEMVRPIREVAPPMIDLLGALAGLGLGLAFVGLAEFRDKSFRTDDEVVRVLSLPVVAVIPVMLSKAERRKRRGKALMTGVTTLVVVVVDLSALAWFLFLRA